MPEIGYALSSEEHTPLDLVNNARRAEDAGFTFALISDHYHPWVDRQGHSPFVWGVIGGIAHATQKLRLGTGVTAPIMRIHPAIIAQAAATAAAMMPDRFFLGVGSGENLNEHVIGAGWPPYELRSDMLVEAIAIIRMLWEGDEVSYYGDHYTVENARIYTLPDTLPPIYMAASGENSAELAGEIADGMITTSPKKELVEAFREAHEGSGPTYGKATGCWAQSKDEARKTAHEWWAFTALPGQLNQELPTPAIFEQAVEMVKPEDMDKHLVLGSSPDEWRQKIQEFVDAGIENVYLHQIGPDQSGFIDWAKKEILPSYR
jgi:coenzyme F420-dependent glucose-6-phosphate dehydrogenase